MDACFLSGCKAKGLKRKMLHDRLLRIGFNPGNTWFNPGMTDLNPKNRL
jgi:hypothetical protein